MSDEMIGALSRLQGLSHRTEAAERLILEQASKMLDACNAELAAVEPKAKIGDPDAEARYQHLVLERGKLNVIIARAREFLAE